MRPDYDGLADVYDIWSQGDPAADPSLAFYVECMSISHGVRVELGIGTGRIGIPILKRGGNLTGVDISSRMLDVCRAKAEAAGVGHALNLLLQDVRRLRLESPAELVTFPFRSIGHLLGDEDKLSCLRSVYANLVPGGWFVFDHYVWDETWARRNDGVARVLAEQDLGDHYLRICDLYRYRYEDRRMDCSVRIQRLADRNGDVLNERVEEFEFSWIDTNRLGELAEAVGFEVEALYGSFSASHAFGPDATDQVWILRRPEIA